MENEAEKEKDKQIIDDDDNYKAQQIVNKQHEILSKTQQEENIQQTRNDHYFDNNNNDNDDDDEIINNNNEDDSPVDKDKEIINNDDNGVHIHNNQSEIKNPIEDDNNNNKNDTHKDEVNNNNQANNINSKCIEIIDIISHTKEEIINYLTGEYTHSNPDISDISYEKWVSKDTNIQALCKEIEIPLRMKFNKLLDSHDLDCEFKLLKWITQDKLHRDKLISLPKEKSHLNRFPHITPYEFNSISLENDSNKYLNASFIDGPFNSDRQLFIATQLPLLNTIDRFFQMILSKKVKVIIMLTGEYEENRYRRESYIPTEQGERKQMGSYLIEIVNEPVTLIEKGLILRRIQITNSETDSIKQIDHLLVKCWDEYSIPRQDIEKTLFSTLFSYVSQCNSELPCVVHCLDGIGRTGTFIALYNISKCINEQKKLNFEVPIINVFNVVRGLREQRIGMVTDSSLYRYIYKIALLFNKTFYDDE